MFCGKSKINKVIKVAAFIALIVSRLDSKILGYVVIGEGDEHLQNIIFFALCKILLQNNTWWLISPKAVELKGDIVQNVGNNSYILSELPLKKFLNPFKKIEH